MTLLNLRSKMHDDVDASMMEPPRYYDKIISLSKSRVIFLNEVFTQEVSAALSSLLIYYDNQSQEDEIIIYINSDGGEEAALVHIYDVMQMISAPVSTVCLGKAYSAGAFILAAGSKGRRHILPHAKVMIHGIQCAFPIMGESDMTGSENYFNFLTNRNDMVLKLLAKHTGKRFEEVKLDCTRDVFLTAEEAKEYGIIDEILY